METGQPKRVKAQPIPVKNQKTKNRDLWATVCYYYPQYTLQEASKLSVRDINLLLRIATNIEAQKMYDLTQIAAAPHTKKGSGVKKLTDYFRKKIK